MKLLLIPLLLSVLGADGRSDEISPLCLRSAREILVANVCLQDQDAKDAVSGRVRRAPRVCHAKLDWLKEIAQSKTESGDVVTSFQGQVVHKKRLTVWNVETTLHQIGGNPRSYDSQAAFRCQASAPVPAN